MAMRGERVERDIAQHAEIGHRLFQRTHGAADEVVGIYRLGPICILAAGVHNREDSDRRDAERCGLAGGVDQRRDRQPLGPGH